MTEAYMEEVLNSLQETLVSGTFEQSRVGDARVFNNIIDKPIDVQYLSVNKDVMGTFTKNIDESKLRRLNQLFGTIELGDDGKYVYSRRAGTMVRKNDIIFFTRTIDSEYIDYKRIIPKDNDIIVTVDRDRFLDGLERANIVADEKIKGSTRSYVKLTTDDQFISITSASVNGRVSDEMECVHEGRDIEIGFNCRFLIDAVKVAEGENLYVKLKNPNQAITIEAVEEDDKFSYCYVIVPVRMDYSGN